MKLIKTSRELTGLLEKTRKDNKSIGLVPTMGALHRGHLSLVEEAEKHVDTVIVTIFVNPTQFNDSDDLKNYPRDLEQDLGMLKAFRKIEAVFAPDVKEMYPEPDSRVFDFGYIEKVMEGSFRKGHFNGVAQIVSKLFSLINPDKAFFGQKDFQQLTIIRHLVKMLNMDIEIISCPIIREPDGLAMSSRNQLLSPVERKHAALISKTLFEGRLKAVNMSVDNLKEWITFTLNNDPLIKVEYFEIVDSIDLSPIKNWDNKGEKVGCIAVKIGKIRLIDNIVF